MAIVDAFAAEGARVAALDRVEPPAGTLRICCDLSHDEDVAQAAKSARELGEPTILIHAAAVSSFGEVLDTTPDELARINDVNVGGALRLVRAFVPPMRARRRGSILFVSSINGGRATPGLAAYAASKGALDTLMRTLALELAPDGVRVNAVAPASIDTPLLQASFARSKDPEAARRANVERHPLGRLGTAQDVAQALVFLASDQASWITGVTLPIDGGASLTRR